MSVPLLRVMAGLDPAIHALKSMIRARILRRPFDWALVLIFAFSAIGLLLANEDPFVREGFCKWLRWACVTSSHAKAGARIIYDISVGTITSIIFYVIVVRIPEFEKRRRIKKSLKHNYDNFREDCIIEILMVADETFEWGFHRTLMRQEHFRDYFQQGVGAGQDRWDAFQNNLNKDSLQQIITKMEIFREDIVFVLNNIEIPDERPFEFLKRLSAAIISMRATSLGYDETKAFASFLWEILAGWSSVGGYQKRDFVEEMIKSI